MIRNDSDESTNDTQIITFQFVRSLGVGQEFTIFFLYILHSFPKLPIPFDDEFGFLAE